MLINTSARLSLALLCTVLQFLQSIESTKQRSWLGPSQFLEGIFPSQRYLHGISSNSDGIYIFGGQSSNSRGLGKEVARAINLLGIIAEWLAIQNFFLEISSISVRREQFGQTSDTAVVESCQCREGAWDSPLMNWARYMSSGVSALEVVTSKLSLDSSEFLF
jgi:hypothetical protein